MASLVGLARAGRCDAGRAPEGRLDGKGKKVFSYRDVCSWCEGFRLMFAFSFSFSCCHFCKAVRMNATETWQSQRKPADPDCYCDKTQFSSLHSYHI
jgi:hypothetical protein